MRVRLFAALATSAWLSVSAALACPPAADTSKEEPKKQMPVKTAAAATFKVDGMHCGGCADRVKSVLDKTDGIISVEVALADKKVKVNYDAAKLSPEKIAKMISDLGYPANAEV